MSNFINTVDVLGDSVVAESIINKTITEFRDNVVTKIRGNAFYQCVQLTDVDLPRVITIESAAFVICSKLTTLILRNEETICSLANANAFNGSEIANKTGYIYVPSALIDSYKSATNWSTYAAQIRAIEDYPEICGG